MRRTTPRWNIYPALARPTLPARGHLAGFAVLLLAALGFLWLSFLVVTQQPPTWDNTLIAQTQAFSGTRLEPLWWVGTEIGYSPKLLVLMGAMLLYLGWRRRWADIFTVIAVGGGAFGVNALMKIFFDRDRPRVLEGMHPNNTSFPSGHAMISATIYGLLLWLIWRSEIDRRWKWLASVIIVPIIAVIGWSRVFYAAHWPSDIVAAWFGALIWLVLAQRLCTLGCDRWNAWRERR